MSSVRKSGHAHHKKHKPRSHKPKKKRRAPGQHPHVLISGYYGFDNLGDELILRVLIRALKERQAHVTVLSQNPEKTRRMYDVEAISRTNVLDIVDVMSRTHLFISGGGGLFQDASGPLSVFYYGGLIHLAAFFEVPVCFWAQGVGPLRRSISRRFTASALRRCDAIVVRDEGSADLIESLTGFRPDVTADPVWLLTLPEDKKKSGRKKMDVDLPSLTPLRSRTERTDSTDKPAFRIGISLRPWKTLDAASLDSLAGCLHGYAALQAQPAELWLLPFQQSEDVPLLQDFAGRLAKQGGTPVVLRSPEQALEDVSTCDVLLGMRFHSLILGLLHEVPVYGLPYDPKVASLLETFALQGTPVDALATLTPDILCDAFAHYPSIHLKPLQKRAQRNLFLLDELLALPEAELLL